MFDYPEYVLTDLRAIRETFELRLNTQAVLLEPGHIDGSGMVLAAKYDPRWELWDTDSDGKEYRVMGLNWPDGSFRAPGQWLVHHMRMLNPEHYGGDLNKMLYELLDMPEILREIGTEKDSDDAIDAASKWGAWLATPKEYVLKSMAELRAEHAAQQAARAARNAATTEEMV